MPAMCPKTHYDLTCDLHPELVMELEDAVCAHPAGNIARTGEEMAAMIGLDFEIALFRKALAKSERQNLSYRRMPGVGTLTDDEVLAFVPRDEFNAWAKHYERELLVLGNFAHHGKKTYFFCDSLAERLADTEMNVDVQLLTLPFPCCMFVYDSQVVRDAIAQLIGNVPRRSGVVSAYMFMTQSIDGGRTLFIAAYIAQRNRPPEGMFRALKLNTGGMIEGALATEWIKENGSAPRMEKWRDEQFYTKGLRVVRIFVNSALYLASSNPDIIPGMRIENLAPQGSSARGHGARAQTKVGFIYVGGSVPSYDRDGSRSGIPIESRVRVQGHWKSQAHGKAFSLRKIIHVEPYWRGPDMAEAINKPYSVR